MPYDRPMARDIGGYFEQMTKKARGGRRLDIDDIDDPNRGANDEPATDPPSGGLGDMLKDILRKGRSTATDVGKTATTTTKKATKSASQKARDRLRRTSTEPSRSRASTRTLPPEGVVTVEYSPRIDGDPDPGEVVWTWVPFEEDPEQGKDRPVVVIGRRNRSLVGVPLTTRQNDREAQIAIGTGDWDPKRRTSYARIWRMLDIDADKTRREGAVLQRDRFDAVIAAVDEYYDIRRPAKTADDDFDYDY